MTLDAPTLPRAVLWDMDGTLVDTEPYWMRAETELADAFGRPWSDEDAQKMIGSGLWNSARLLQEAGIDLDADEIVDRLTARVQDQLATHGVPWRPGALELLTALHDRGVPCALVTMSVSRMARQVARAIDFEAFRVVVTGDTVARPKPDPEAYLTAARLLDVEAGDCVALEDSPSGLASAVAAGTIAIGVPHMAPLPREGDHTLWPSLVGRGLDDLAALTAARRAP